MTEPTRYDFGTQFMDYGWKECRDVAFQVADRQIILSYSYALLIGCNYDDGENTRIWVLDTTHSPSRTTSRHIGHIIARHGTLIERVPLHTLKFHTFTCLQQILNTPV